jgi:hypothetical protein
MANLFIRGAVTASILGLLTFYQIDAGRAGMLHIDQIIQLHRPNADAIQPTTFWGEPYPYGYAYANPRQCWQPRRVETRNGIRVLPVWVCGRR